MTYLETVIELSVKEILEILVVIISFILVYFSYKTYTDLKNIKSLFSSPFKLINFGFIFFSLSMLCELIDSFYLENFFIMFYLRVYKNKLLSRQWNNDSIYQSKEDELNES